VQAGLAQATFDQRRQLVELLIDRVVVTDGDVEIRYVIPTTPASEHVRFCHLRTDYFDAIALAVDSTGERAALAFRTLVRDRVPDAVLAEPPPDAPTAVAFIAHHTLWSLTGTPAAFPLDAAVLHEVGERGLVMPLAGAHQQYERGATPVGPHVEFRAEATAAAP